MTNITNHARMRPNTPGEKIKLAIVFAVLGLIFIMIGYPGHRNIKKAKTKCTETVTAVVINTEQKDTRGRNGSTTLYRATLELPPELGVTSNRVVTEWSKVRFIENGEISVKYDPNDHKRIYVPGNPPNDRGKNMMTMGVIFIGIGALYFIGFQLIKDRQI